MDWFIERKEYFSLEANNERITVNKTQSNTNRKHTRLHISLHN